MPLYYLINSTYFMPLMTLLFIGAIWYVRNKLNYFYTYFLGFLLLFTVVSLTSNHQSYEVNVRHYDANALSAQVVDQGHYLVFNDNKTIVKIPTKITGAGMVKDTAVSDMRVTREHYLRKGLNPTLIKDAEFYVVRDKNDKLIEVMPVETKGASAVIGGVGALLNNSAKNLVQTPAIVNGVSAAIKDSVLEVTKK